MSARSVAAASAPENDPTDDPGGRVDDSSTLGERNNAGHDQGGEWITRAEAAALARKTPGTIRRYEHKHRLPTRIDDRGAVLVNVDDLVRIGCLRREDLAPAGGARESAELARSRELVTELKVRVAELGAQVSSSERLVSSLLSQLEAKDKQLGQLTRVHEALVMRVPAGGAAAGPAAVGAGARQ